MARAHLAALASLVAVLAAPGHAQLPEDDGPYAAAFRDVSVAGIAGGNATVDLLLYYPGATTGNNAAVDLSGAPYPLIVFGHGFSLPTSLYDSLYRHLATHGYLVAGVATEEGLLTGNLTRFIADFQATVVGLRAAAASSGFLAGALAPNGAVAAAGHSFGGDAALVAAAQRPDVFDGVISMAAPSSSPQGVNILGAVNTLAVPTLHLGASEDVIVPPATNLDPLYAATPPWRRLLEIEGGTHSYFHERWWIDRLLEPAGSITVAEQQRMVRRYTLPFFEWVCRGDSRLLDYLLGPTATGDPGLSRQDVSLDRGLLFGAGSGAIGTSFRWHPARTPGDTAVLLAAAAPAGVSTPFGTLLLDPSSLLALGRVPVGVFSYGTVNLTIPNVATLRGQSVFFQALLLSSTEGELSNPSTLTIP